MSWRRSAIKEINDWALSKSINHFTNLWGICRIVKLQPKLKIPIKIDAMHKLAYNYLLASILALDLQLGKQPLVIFILQIKFFFQSKLLTSSESAGLPTNPKERLRARALKWVYISKLWFLQLFHKNYLIQQKRAGGCCHLWNGSKSARSFHGWSDD